jgi:hypothetical protein
MQNVVEQKCVVAFSKTVLQKQPSAEQVSQTTPDPTSSSTPEKETFLKVKVTLNPT